MYWGSAFMSTTGILLCPLFLLLPSFYMWSLPVRDTAQLILALRQHISFQYVIIMTVSEDGTQGLDNWLGVCQLYKALHQSGWSVQVKHLNLSKDSYNNYRYKQNIWNEHTDSFQNSWTSLILLPSSNTATQMLLAKWWNKSSLENSQSSNWLLLLDNSTIEDYFATISISMASLFLVAQQQHDGVNLTEVFRVPGLNPLDMHNVGFWNRTSLHWTEQGFYQRRSNLQGKVLLVITQHKLPFIDVHQASFPRFVGGIVGQIWHTLERRLNFSSNFTLIYEKSNYISEIDLVTRIVIDSNIDIGIGDITHEQLLTTNMLYTAPLSFTTVVVFIKHPGVETLHWSGFLIPFTLDLWLIIVGLLVLASICLCLMRWHESAYNSAVGLVSETVLVLLGTLCQQGSIVSPSSNSGRIAMLVMHITAMTLLAGYSAALISSLALRSVSLPFYDIEGLVEDGTYKFLVLYYTAEHVHFSTTGDPTMVALRTNSPKYVLSVMEGLENICTSKSALFIKMHQVLAERYRLPCPIVPLPGFSLRKSVSIVVNQLNPYQHILSYHLNSLRRSGVLWRLINSGHLHNLPEPEEVEIRVNIWNILPILSLLAAGMSAASFLLILEFFWGYLRLKWYRQYQRYQIRRMVW